KKEGDFVNKGEVIAEIETDKADMELESFASGILTKILYQEGDTVPVGTVIAILGETEKKAEMTPQEIVSSPPTSREKAVSTESISQEKIAEKKAEVTKTTLPDTGEKKILKISPRARRLIEEKGIPVSEIKGSGPGGRIVAEDIKRFLKETKPEKTEEESRVNIPEVLLETSGEKVVELSRMRKAIARRMSLSKQTIPHFYVTQEIGMGAAVDFIENLNQKVGDEVKITYNDLVIKATALALRDYPEINAHFNENRLIIKKDINIGVIVAVKEGLIVPVVKNADMLTLKEVSTTLKGLRERVFKRESTPEDLTGGSFSVSNMGMFGVEEFAAIINPPQVGILAVAAIKDKPVIKDGSIKPAKIMKVTLSADHRALDGVRVAKFLQLIKELLENPVVLE
ncbi:MAG: 2-oxo acid dehydrogenase subunit E2, partial [Desulfobacterota bacterium]|nr:2-oxo acid dehydrogenase subunit E2 [Thermodesulfobacteriota bacterium]